jgi:hypothetical protein
VSSDFISLLERLVRAGVDFVVVGGFAGITHGCTLVTQDIDICCDFDPDNLLRLQKAISDLNPVHRMTTRRKKFELPEKNGGKFKNLYLDTDIGQLDCVSFVEGIGDYRQVKQASVPVKMQNTKIRVLSIDALIKTKKAMNRPRDRQAVMQLEAIKKLKKQRPDHK